MLQIDNQLKTRSEGLFSQCKVTEDASPSSQWPVLPITFIRDMRNNIDEGTDKFAVLLNNRGWLFQQSYRPTLLNQPQSLSCAHEGVCCFGEASDLARHQQGGRGMLWDPCSQAAVVVLQSQPCVLQGQQCPFSPGQNSAAADLWTPPRTIQFHSCWSAMCAVCPTAIGKETQLPFTCCLHRQETCFLFHGQRGNAQGSSINSLLHMLQDLHMNTRARWEEFALGSLSQQEHGQSASSTEADPMVVAWVLEQVSSSPRIISVSMISWKMQMMWFLSQAGTASAIHTHMLCDHSCGSLGLFLELRPRFKSWCTRKNQAERTEVPFGKILILASSNVSWANICQRGSEWLLWPSSLWKVYRTCIAAGRHTWRSIRCYPPSVSPRHWNARGASGLGWRHNMEVPNGICQV